MNSWSLKPILHNCIDGLQATQHAAYRASCIPIIRAPADASILAVGVCWGTHHKIIYHERLLLEHYITLNKQTALALDRIKWIKYGIPRGKRHLERLGIILWKPCSHPHFWPWILQPTGNIEQWRNVRRISREASKEQGTFFFTWPQINLQPTHAAGTRLGLPKLANNVSYHQHLIEYSCAS